VLFNFLKVGSKNGSLNFFKPIIQEGKLIVRTMRNVCVETPAKLYTLSCFTFESEKLPSQPRRFEINTFRSYLLLQTGKISRKMKKNP
jgi:hypothetical protein